MQHRREGGGRRRWRIGRFFNFFARAPDPQGRPRPSTRKGPPILSPKAGAGSRPPTPVSPGRTDRGCATDLIATFMFLPRLPDVPRAPRVGGACAVPRLVADETGAASARSSSARESAPALNDAITGMASGGAPRLHPPCLHVETREVPQRPHARGADEQRQRARCMICSMPGWCVRPGFPLIEEVLDPELRPGVVIHGLKAGAVPGLPSYMRGTAVRERGDREPPRRRGRGRRPRAACPADPCGAAGCRPPHPAGAGCRRRPGSRRRPGCMSVLRSG